MAVYQVEENPVCQEVVPESDAPQTQEEFDFVEPPSEDFFCPVTFEFLLNPHQTRCCGHHLSERAVNRLQRDGKPCPMCKEAKLDTIPDKFIKRKTSAVLIRCPHNASGCEWVGEVGGSKQHTEACPKRAWKCQYCDFESTFEVAAQHEDECTNYPIPCPNKCVVNSAPEASPLSETQICMIPRCDMEKHRAECPLEVVDCEFVEIGCKVKTTRQDLKRHMEESQQEHLLSATILNLRLTKETIAEKDHQLAEKDRQLATKDCQLAKKDQLLAEKDSQLTEKDHQLAELLAKNNHQLIEKNRQLADKDQLLAKKDHQLTEKGNQLADKDRLLAKKDRRLTEKDHKLAEKDRQLADKDRLIAKKDRQLTEQSTLNDQHLLEKDKAIATKDSQLLEALLKGVTEVTGGMLGFACHSFVLENFSECQRNSYGDWFSEPFHLDSEAFKLNVETAQLGNHMNIRLYSETPNNSVFILILQMLNQLSNHGHFLLQFEVTGSHRNHLDWFYSTRHEYILFKELYKKGGEVQYLKNDSLKFVLWIKKSS